MLPQKSQTAHHWPLVDILFRKKGWVLYFIVLGGLLALSVLAMAARAVMNYHSDDNHFAMGAQLVAEGYTPYVHFPYFQMPYAAYIFGTVLKFDLGIYKYLTLRLVNLTFCLAAITVIYFICLEAAKSKIVALAGVLLLSSSEFLNLAVEQLNSYAIANFFAILSFGSLLIANQSANRRIFLSSLFLGAAIASKLYYVLLAPPLLVFAMALSQPPTRRAILPACALWCAGLAVALIPVGLIAAVDPAAFVFGNYGYHILNSEYRELSQSGDGMSLSAKLKFLAQIFGKPIYLSVVIFGIFLIPYVRRHFTTRQFEHRALLAAAGSFSFMLIAAMVPRPLWPSYFLAPLPFAVISLAYMYGIAGNTEELRKQPWDLRLASVAIFVASLAIPTNLYQLKRAMNVDSWSTVTIHEHGKQLHDLVVGQGINGKLLAFEGLYAIEAGLPFYRQMAGANFAYRVGDLMDDHLRARSHVTSKINIASVLDASPPAAILLSSRFDRFNSEILKYAMTNKYIEFQTQLPEHRLFIRSDGNK